ncbi:hypothetical protein CA51_26200 [Rosistilla oblonga]|uniref:Uncharacterized protein n=1 Tax=Rosistilla oblonga TaxID=2527990 RepID=A0A518J1H4_9BACT|nr:hypothetical protein [Rosistilla oblonga]QDV12734.1 hypothetical protein CA51_26200 [Rosistilla oblonga]QDV59168.1 hypothetical protein Mal33_51960 [Rosistilla oblonga]
MRRSILEAVQDGDWAFEPLPCDEEQYEPTAALPGSAEKLDVLQCRVQQGLPLWHPSDRRFYREEAGSIA